MLSLHLADDHRVPVLNAMGDEDHRRSFYAAVHAAAQPMLCDADAPAAIMIFLSVVPRALTFVIDRIGVGRSKLHSVCTLYGLMRGAFGFERALGGEGRVLVRRLTLRLESH
jgi:hypothetical protein